jgi:hypothetical protein
MRLFDMLKRYAFSFYEVVLHIEELQKEARVFTSASIYSGQKAPTHRREGMIACLKAMRTECEKLDLTHTASLISFGESEVQRKGDDHTYTDISKGLDT